MSPSKQVGKACSSRKLLFGKVSWDLCSSETWSFLFTFSLSLSLSSPFRSSIHFHDWNVSHPIRKFLFSSARPNMIWIQPNDITVRKYTGYIYQIEEWMMMKWIWEKDWTRKRRMWNWSGMDKMRWIWWVKEKEGNVLWLSSVFDTSMFFPLFHTAR